MKTMLRVSFPDDDALISGLIVAAREWCEAFCQRRFITQQVQLSIDYFPGYIDYRLTGSRISTPFVSGSNAVLVGIRYAIVLPYSPVQSIDTFTYLANNQDTVTMQEGTDYRADLLSNPARLTPVWGAVWPVALVETNAVQITYTVGYGDATAVPESVIHAIKLLASYWYANRIPDQEDVPMAVRALLGQYRDLRL
jgi:hypothetical protein